jgi:SPP1 family phage portal protein
MTIEEIVQLPIAEQITALQYKSVELPSYDELAAQYDPDQHAVFSTTRRPPKTVVRGSGRLGPDNKEIMETQTEDVNRIAVPFQRIIVDRTIGFLLGNPVKMRQFVEKDQQQQDQEILAAMVQKTMDDNKIDSFNRMLARAVMSECEAAELWYVVEDPGFWRSRIKSSANLILKLRSKILSPSRGDKLYPLFDASGDMIAFSREYQIKTGAKTEQHFDTYTAQWIILRQKDAGGEWVEQRAANLMQKIPVIYYSQPMPEWHTVQSMIDRFETKLSNFADTNDYFGSPMVKVSGEVVSLPGKTSSGKVLMLEQGASADYMSWSHAPESEKLEFELLEKLIYANTQTPNISFEQMKQIGGGLSGFAIKLMFTDAHLKVANKIELFGEMFQRRFNLLKHVCGTVLNVALAPVVDILWIEPQFTPFLPKNTMEEIQTLAMARANKPLLSNETALENNPLVTEVETEMERMKADANDELALTTAELTGNFNL